MKHPDMLLVTFHQGMNIDAKKVIKQKNHMVVHYDNVRSCNKSILVAHFTVVYYDDVQSYDRPVIKLFALLSINQSWIHLLHTSIYMQKVCVGKICPPNTCDNQAISLSYIYW